MKRIEIFSSILLLIVFFFFPDVNAQQKVLKATTAEYVPVGMKSVTSTTPIPDVFVDNVCSGLKPGITLNQIQSIENEFFKNVALSMYNNEYTSEFRIQSYKPYLAPGILNKENKTGSNNWLDNLTGIYTEAGDTLVILVGDTKGETVFIRQIDLDKEEAKSDGYGNKTDYPLSQGINKIITAKKGLIYVMYHLYEKRETMPDPVKIHIASGMVNGYFDLNRHNNTDWVRLLANAKGKYLDIIGNYSQATFPVASYRTYCPNDGKGLISVLDSISYLERELMGFFKYPNRNPECRQYYCVVYSGYMFAAGDHTGYHVSTMATLCSVSTLRGKNSWGPAHELGHQNQTRPGFKWAALAEVSNNLFSAYVQTKLWKQCQLYTDKPSTGRNNHYENAYNMIMVPTTKNGNEFKIPHMLGPGEFNRLAPFWQLYLYSTFVKNQPDFYKDVFEQLRVRADRAVASQSGLISLDFTVLCSEIMQEDLSVFFEAWNFYQPMTNVKIGDYADHTVNIETGWANTAKTNCGKQGTKPTYMIQYIDDNNIDIFVNKKSIISGTATKSGNAISMKGWQNAIAYEVYDKGKLVFIASKPDFKLIRQVPAGTNNASGNPEYKQESFDVADPEIYAVAWNGEKVKAEIQQSALPAGLNVSDETNTYWYYIQNAINYVASGSGEGLRVGSYITSVGTSEQAKLWNLFFSGNKDYQLWKVVAAPTKGQYYLVNKANGYKLGFGASPLDPARYYTTPSSATPFTINKCTGSDYYVTLNSNGGTALLGGWGGGALYDGSGSYNTAPSAPDSPLLPAKGPRGWIFIPESEVNECYPELSNENGDSWYFIESITQGRVLYDDVSAEHALKIDYKAGEVSNDAQLWKFVKQANSTAFCDSIYIINKSTGRYITGVSTEAEPKGFVLQHLLRSDIIQFRLCPSTLQPSLRAKADGSIVREDVLPCGWGTDNAFRIVKQIIGENAINKVQENKYSVYSENGYIKVKDTNLPFKVYTIYGVEVNAMAKQLPGVYVVKIGDISSKIMVK